MVQTACGPIATPPPEEVVVEELDLTEVVEEAPTEEVLVEEPEEIEVVSQEVGMAEVQVIDSVYGDVSTTMDE